MPTTTTSSNHQPLIDSFRTHLIRLGYQTWTCQMLPRCLAEFLAFSQIEVSQVNPAIIQAFYEHLQQRPHKRSEGGLSSRYIHHFVYSLQLFFCWLLESGQLSVNPISGMEFETPSHQTREILTIAEIKQLYEICESLRESAILSLFYGCGLRRSEGEQLNLRDVHFKDSLLYVRSGKNGKRRVVPMGEKVKASLWNYVLHERYSVPLESGFICGMTGNRLQGNQLNKILKSLLSRTEITKKISLHSLRHSIATHLIEQGLSVDYVREFLGHQHLETTQLYTRINSNQLWKIKDTNSI